MPLLLHLRVLFLSHGDSFSVEINSIMEKQTNDLMGFYIVLKLKNGFLCKKEEMDQNELDPAEQNKKITHKIERKCAFTSLLSQISCAICCGNQRCFSWLFSVSLRLKQKQMRTCILSPP